MQRYAQEFQDLHQILYVVGAIDGSYLPIVAPPVACGRLLQPQRFPLNLVTGR